MLHTCHRKKKWFRNHSKLFHCIAKLDTNSVYKTLSRISSAGKRPTQFLAIMTRHVIKVIETTGARKQRKWDECEKECKTQTKHPKQIINNKAKQKQWCWACVVCFNSCISPPWLVTLVFSQTNIRDFGDAINVLINTREEINFWFKQIKLKLSETKNWTEVKNEQNVFSLMSLRRSSEIWNVLCVIFFSFSSPTNRTFVIFVCLIEAISFPTWQW